ncbi:MAG: IS3 family transposase [Flavobacteriales bacterium]|nr:IS3 family transposase [Bacteroidota bacterium]
MKAKHKHIRLELFCRLFGVTRQSNYQYFKNNQTLNLKQELVIQRVNQIRASHYRIGTRKLFELMKPFLIENDIKIGRDALFNLLGANQLLIRKRIRKVNTTYSQHWMRKWPNLIKGRVTNRPNQLWVSDITFWKVADKFLYISLITDAYSKKVVGYSLAPTLEQKSTCRALMMAINNNSNYDDLTHHSDRGVQYCSHDYIKILKRNNILISMTENGDPRENAIAERINGILKHEYLLRYKPKNIKQAEFILQKAVLLYNHERPHLSISLLTPEHVHSTNTKTQRKWKNYFNTKTVKLF